MSSFESKINLAPDGSVNQINEYLERLNSEKNPISVDAAIAGIAKAVKLGKGDGEYSAEMKAFTGHLFGQDRSRVYAKKIVELKGSENASPIPVAGSAMQTAFELGQIVKAKDIKQNIANISLEISKLNDSNKQKSAIKKVDIMLAELLSYAKLKSTDSNFEATVRAELTKIMDLLDIPLDQRK